MKAQTAVWQLSASEIAARVRIGRSARWPVPFTVKEDIDVEGSATTFGVPRLRHLVASADAPPVRRLRAADAIPIGRINLPDLSIGGAHTTSQLYGATKDPWDLAKSPGGSSRGDGVAVATAWRWRPAWRRSDWATTPAAPSDSRRCSAAWLG